jgi:topoisomerase-4 subunit B
MNPTTRTLLRVEIDEDDRPGTTKTVDQLMGNKPDARFKFIQERAAFAEADDLDI